MEKNTSELILEAKCGSQSAFADLRERYSPLIDSCIFRFLSDGMTDQDKEDLAQEALIKFCSAVCSYDSEYENVEFGLYAKICIENGLVSFIRSHNRKNRIRPVSLEGEIAEDIIGEGDILQSLVDRERTSILVRKIIRMLSDYENRVWWMYASGMSASEIAAAVGADAKSVSNAVYRIRKKLRDKLKLQDQDR